MKRLAAQWGSTSLLCRLFRYEICPAPDVQIAVTIDCPEPLEGCLFRFVDTIHSQHLLKGQLVQGVQYFFTDYEKARVTETQFHVIQAVKELYPDKGAFEVITGYGLFDKVCGTDYVRLELAKRYKAADIQSFWRKDEDSFRTLSQNYHIY